MMPSRPKNNTKGRMSSPKANGHPYLLRSWAPPAGEVKELEHVIQRYIWNVIGLAETRYTGCVEFITGEGHKIWFSGEKDEHEKCVGFVVNKNTIRSSLECTPVSSRIITIRLKAQAISLTIMQIYAPISDSEDNDVELFYQELDEVIRKINKKGVLIIQGDWNAKIGADAYENFGLKARTMGNSSARIAKQHKLVVSNTSFRHKKSRTATWHSPGGISHSQIDFIKIQKRYQLSINDAKTRAFFGSGHQQRP
ncbi:craniofacial development protein 2-like [Penaeus indicus]|uniref:craniofacial development protein 2-like n=1 Tax=Penaeus indicus TaxID=29960 RepID=UPI00300D3AAF